MSICIARTEEGWRNGERVSIEVNGDGVWHWNSWWDSNTEISSSEPLEVRGELVREG